MAGFYLFAAISIILGGASCFFGKKMFYPMLMIMVFSLVFTGCISGFGGGVKGILISLGISIVALLLSKFLYKAAVFIVCSLAGTVIGAIVSLFVPSSYSTCRWLVILVIAIGLGVCGVLWCDTVIMLSTSYGGATMMVTVLFLIIYNIDNLEIFKAADMEASFVKIQDYMDKSFMPAHSALVLLSSVVLALIGFLFQRKSNAKQIQQKHISENKNNA